MKDPDNMLLRGMAEMAFGLGLEHGRKRSKPIDSERLLGDLKLAYLHSSADVEFRVIHRLKLRQVYGAGFDITYTIRKVEDR